MDASSVGKSFEEIPASRVLHYPVGSPIEAISALNTNHFHKFTTKRNNATCSTFDPRLGGQERAVATGFISNSLEFEGIETSVVNLFPDAEEKHRVPVFLAIPLSALSELLFKSGYAPSF